MNEKIAYDVGIDFAGEIFIRRMIEGEWTTLFRSMFFPRSGCLIVYTQGLARPETGAGNGEKALLKETLLTWLTAQSRYDVRSVRLVQHGQDVEEVNRREDGSWDAGYTDYR